MKAYNMQWIQIESLAQAARKLAQIGVHPEGIPYLAGQAFTRVIKLEQVPPPAAHILKQEMLALGGDAAVNRELIVNGVKETDVLLMGSYKQLRMLIGKLKEQEFGLPVVAESLHQLLNALDKMPGKLDCRGIDLQLGKKTFIMGILNATPDSFSDGGKFYDTEDAMTHARQLIADGADIIDIGAESSRPGYTPISAEEEWERLKPVLQKLVPDCKVPISVDTQKAEVAEKALDLGVHIINDIWGLQKDSRMAEVVADAQAAVVIMHNKINTDYNDLMGEVISYLEKSIETALKKGVQEDRIAIDPGIGFGKTPSQNMEVLRRLEELRVLGFPVLLGVSRKSVIGRTLNLPVDQRLEPTIALGTLGIAAGVDILRVHDVLENKKAAMMADWILRREEGEDHEG